METVTIKGLAELRKALTRTIPVEMQGKVLQKALGAGASLTVRRARVLAPVRTGVLRRAIYATRDRFHSKRTFEVRAITVRKGRKAAKSKRDAYYWHFIEFGHRKASRRTGYLRKRSGAGESGRVPAQPFLRPAFESTKFSATEAIKDKLRLLIEDAARKARW